MLFYWKANINFWESKQLQQWKSDFERKTWRSCRKCKLSESKLLSLLISFTIQKEPSKSFSAILFINYRNLCKLCVIFENRMTLKKSVRKVTFTKLLFRAKLLKKAVIAWSHFAKNNSLASRLPNTGKSFKFRQNFIFRVVLKYCLKT